MRSARSMGTAVWLSMTLLGMGAGCTVSIQPWTKTTAGPVAGPAHDTVPGNPYLSALQAGGAPRPLPPDMGNEGMQIWLKQMREAEDQRKGMVEHAQFLKKELRDREEIMSRASVELELSKKDLKRVREEMQVWQAEVDSLRERVRKLEENRASLRPVLDQIIYQLDREREPAMIRLPKQ